jgi:hypothetical protein
LWAITETHVCIGWPADEKVKIVFQGKECPGPRKEKEGRKEERKWEAQEPKKYDKQSSRGERREGGKMGGRRQ